MKRKWLFIVKYISDFIYTLVDERLHEVLKTCLSRERERNCIFFIYSLKQQTNKQKQEEINSSRVYCYNDRGHLRANAKQINVELSLNHLLSL